MSWICDKCHKETERLKICWGTDNGRKVDIIDYFCLYCLSNSLNFQGTKTELEEYWDMEWQ